MASDYYHVASAETRTRSVLHSIGVAAAAFIAGYALAVLVMLVLLSTGFMSRPVEDVSALPLSILTIAQFVGFGIVVYAYIRWTDDRDLLRVSVPSLVDLVWIGGGFVALIIVGLAVSAIIQFFQADTATNQVVELGQQNPTLFLYMIPVTIFFVAPAEELVFRGVVQGLFKRAYGLVPGVILASLLFGVGHYLALSGGGKLTYIAVTVALGLVLGTVYELSDNLAVPIVIHGLWNTLIFGMQYLVVTGLVEA